MRIFPKPQTYEWFLTRAFSLSLLLIAWGGLLVAAMILPAPYRFVMLLPAIALVLFGARRRNAAAKDLGIGLGLFTVFAHYAVGGPESKIDDYNPQIESHAEIIGTYSDGTSEITLAPDGSFTTRNLASPRQGTWYRDDHTLHLGHGDRLRFVTYAGKYHLIRQADPESALELILPKLEAPGRAPAH